ncbi:hypothetical protein ACIA8G_21480 [Lentzea sp. NPDC051213]|uniref:hypothetical protein n=1 Tax=Lentzea sp. NPDC051213 TaxID=3364126 RepID=UPI00379D754A
MSLTANFDYCAELGIDLVRQIFHLAFKSEDRYPHNIGPFERDFTGQPVKVWVRVLDDDTDVAELSFPNSNHVLFSFPFEIRTEVPGAPDPALSRITMKARVEVPASISAWLEGETEVLGLSFEGITANAVTVVTLDGLPDIDASRFAETIHARYLTIPHTYSRGGGTLVLYDGNRDPGLNPPNAATPQEIQVALETHSNERYLKVVAPMHASVPAAGNFAAYGRTTFWRKVTSTSATITVDMTSVPPLPALQTTVDFDSSHPAKGIVESQLRPLIDGVLRGYGTLTEPGFDETGAEALLQAEVANYLVTRRFPIYSPQPLASGAPLTSPIGFTVGGSVFAVLLNRRTGTPADDHPPDDFLAGAAVALAVGRTKVDEQVAEAIATEFPGLGSGGHLIEVPEGSATLQTLSVVPADPGEHEVDRGHLWVSGTAEVHIDCWPDPDVFFAGPLFLDVHTGEDPDGGCSFTIQATPGEFDIDESCCDVFLDLIIPIVGWIMLAIVESTIDAVGGELVKEIGERQARHVEAFPPVVNGIAEISTCVTDLRVSAEGFVFPAQAKIRRLGESFEDRAADHDLPRP